jgi:hypothetical protein
VTAENVRDLAIVAVLVMAPLTCVAIVALVRGYSINLTMKRSGGRRRRRDDD